MTKENIEYSLQTKFTISKDDFIRLTILKHTKIKEPITAGKIKWHGLALCQEVGKPNTFWVTQKGKQVGEVFTLSIN